MSDEKKIEDVLEEGLDAPFEDKSRGITIEAAEAEIAKIKSHDKVSLNSEEKEFQAAVDASAEQRAKTPFEVACMQHSRMYPAFVDNLEKVSGGAAKRILRYLVGYPFFVDNLNPQDKHVEALAYMAHKLGETKYTITLIQAMEQEAKAMQQLNEHAKIKEMDLEGKNDGISNTEETKQGE
jgi:hypothetical protein